MVAPLKPRLRGWLHFGAAPTALLLGLALLVFTDARSMRAAVGIYVATTVLLFGVSAAYHLGAGSPATNRFLNRLDHANIYVFIAGAVLLLVLGGVLYTLGGVIYARKRPNPAPAWFGFHELFHAFTIAAYLVHHVAVWRVV